MVKKAVVYGAGQSGRGYVGRFLQEANYQVTFVERDKHLVQLLNEDDHFLIHFYHKDRTPVLINNYKVLSLEDDLSTVLKETDIILISVGEQNLGEVAASIAKFLNEDEVPQLLTAENGTNPARVLNIELAKHYNTDFSTKISQTAIFCSTINIEETRLDILSQNETYFPYDSEGFKGELDFLGAEPRDNFEYFFERKIYTYNCLAGLISYLGYIKGYKIYGEAANDIEIAQIIDELLYELNPSLANYFDISLDEQNQFANKAVDKFKDLKILDFVIKNGRAPRRKLGKAERIYAPYKILLDQKKDPSIMYLIAGSALVYLEEIEFEGKEFNPVSELQSILKMQKNDTFIEQSVATYYNIVNNRKNIQLLNLLSAIRAS